MHDESNQRWGKGSRFRVTSPNRQVDVALSIYLPKEETVFSTLSTLTAGLFTPFWVLTVCTVLFKTRPAPAHLRAGAGCVRLVLGAAGSCVPVVRAPAPFALLCLPFGDAQTSSDRQSCAFAALPGGENGGQHWYLFATLGSRGTQRTDFIKTRTAMERELRKSRGDWLVESKEVGKEESLFLLFVLASFNLFLEPLLKNIFQNI
ncbi:uncharacterized protein LOC121232559 isoform X1 [Aquila chrysaetos chrysaetos]|uniref:uncharacterized protein LOC121232559 isoform X1 n=1 Tax=Aquila chrysaetos chrysaetos TaxID=223781 RepID=UPI001B7D3167|nr:uncharacterized protein LOC121232559 isoform X1 [Aquila chrysaetos chrysaetos]